MWGDEGLLHMIANRAQLRCANRGPITSNRVLNTLSRRSGDLVPAWTQLQSGRRVRIFWLPEHAPEWAKKRASGKLAG